MQSGGLKLKTQIGACSDVAPAKTGAILVIGEVSRWRAQGRDLPGSQDIHCIELHELAAEFLELVQPDVIFSPLLSNSFDCLDVAVLLQEIGYRGRYRVMSADLPNPWLIRAEISEACPDLDFDVINLKDTTKARLN